MTDQRRPVRTGAARARRGATEEIGRRNTSASYSYKGEVTQENTQDEKLGLVSFGPGEEPAFVRVGAGNTFNMGNYESLRIDVSVTLPCHPHQIDETYRQASDWVAEKMAEEEQAWLPTSGGSKKASSKR